MATEPLTCPNESELYEVQAEHPSARARLLGKDWLSVSSTETDTIKHFCTDQRSLLSVKRKQMLQSQMNHNGVIYMIVSGPERLASGTLAAAENVKVMVMEAWNRSRLISRNRQPRILTEPQ